MTAPWQTEVFFSAQDGVNSAVDPDLIGPRELAWMLNGTTRGGKPATRPPMRSRMYLPQGLVQGASYCSLQGGMIIVSVAGRPYRLRIGAGTDDYSYEAIPLSYFNSSVLRQAWMQETVGSLVIQDGQSDPIIFDGSTARRSATANNEVPLGKQMAYGNGRLWVAVGGNTAVAGDIVVDGDFQSELQFTETNYLSGGGSLSFPGDIRAMRFIPARDSADYGPLLVCGRNFGKLIRADITSRDLWAVIPKFVSDVLTSIGASGHWNMAAVNQDIYWRDSDGGIRSLGSAIRDQNDAGSAPLSTEVSRITNFESEHLLEFGSIIYFDNRLLLTASPYLNPQGGISFKSLISLDFAPISTMRGKSQPAYDGQWSGVGFSNLVAGDFNGRRRAFAISSDVDGDNRLWEILTSGRDDSSEIGDSRIVSYLESPRRNFGHPKNRKRVERCDVYLIDVDGHVDLKVYWRPDNNQKWNQWSEVEVCAQTTDPSTDTPHAWQNLLPQYRPQIKTFTVPVVENPIVKFPNSVGFEFQLRIAWTGKTRIARVLLHASIVDDPNYAQQDLVTSTCVYNDVTGNEIVYQIPIIIASGLLLSTEDGFDITTEGGELLGTG